MAHRMARWRAIPLGTSLMCSALVQVCLGFIKTGELPHIDHGDVDGLEDDTLPVDIDVYGMKR